MDMSDIEQSGTGAGIFRQPRERQRPLRLLDYGFGLAVGDFSNPRVHSSHCPIHRPMRHICPMRPWMA